MEEINPNIGLEDSKAINKLHFYIRNSIFDVLLFNCHPSAYTKP